MNWQEALLIVIIPLPRTKELGASMVTRIEKGKVVNQALFPGTDTHHFHSHFIAKAIYMATLISKRQKSIILPYALKMEHCYIW